MFASQFRCPTEVCRFIISGVGASTERRDCPSCHTGQKSIRRATFGKTQPDHVRKLQESEIFIEFHRHSSTYLIFGTDGQDTCESRRRTENHCGSVLNLPRKPRPRLRLQAICDISTRPQPGPPSLATWWKWSFGTHASKE